MNNKVSLLLTAGLLACSMQALAAPPVALPKADPAAAPAATTVAATAAPQKPPSVVIRNLPLPPPATKDSSGLPLPRFCHLGDDCMALDSHPFEMCHVS